MSANTTIKIELQWSFRQMARLLEVAGQARGCTIGQAKGHEPEVLKRGSLSTVSPDWISVAIYQNINKRLGYWLVNLEIIVSIWVLWTLRIKKAPIHHLDGI